MDGVNAVTIIGNVGNITEMFVTNSNKKVVNISIATSESYFDVTNTKKSETQWHNIVLWNTLAEIATKFITKGCLVYVEGKLNYRKKQDNSTVTEIVAKSIRVLSRKKDKEDWSVIAEETAI